MAIAKLRILGAYLGDRRGHDYDYTLALVTAAREAGIACEVYGSAASIASGLGTRRLTLGAADRLARLRSQAKHGLAAKMVEKAFGRLVVMGCARHFRGSNSSDLWLVHTAPNYMLEAIAAAWRQAPAGRLVLVVRHVGWDEAKQRARMVRLGELAERLTGLRLASDSRLIAAEIGAACGSAVAELPIPLSHRRDAAAETRALFTYLGGRRRQKGFHLLPSIVAVVRKAIPDAGFEIQAYGHAEDAEDAEVEQALAELRRLEGVTVIDRVLDAEAFQVCIERAHVILLPYDTRIYGSGTTGLFAAAMATGRAVLHSGLAWANDEARRFGLTRARAVSFRDDRELAAAAIETLALCKMPPTEAEAGYAAWHSPGNLLAKLISL